MLALSGDYPVTGHRGLAAPVFDIDSVGLLSLFAEMNEGLRDDAEARTRGSTGRTSSSAASSRTTSATSAR